MSGARHWLSWLAVVALVAAAVATAGWGNDTSEERHEPAPAPAGTRVSVVAAVGLVERIDLVRDDLPAGYREVPARAGNDLDPGDRLHFCAAAVPAATGRLAGHRRAFRAPDGRRVRTEVAFYANDGAARALAALRAQAPRCSVPVPPGGVELPSSLALHVRVRPGPDGPRRRELVVLRSGAVLEVLEVDGADASRTVELARLLAGRLASSGEPARAGVPPAALAAVALVPGDLPAGFAVQSDRYGRQLDDSPNRDVCGRALAGDAHRLSARQLVLTGNGRRVTGEVASYERGGAADVLRQLRGSVTECPRGPGPDLQRGVQNLERRYTVAATHAGPSSLAVLVTVTDMAGHRRRSEVVYQRRGEVLSALTVDPVDGDGDELLRRTASVLGARLHRSGADLIG